MERSDRDVIVVGGGPAGLIAAIALAHRGVRTTLLAPKPPHPDRRTTALLGRSVEILQELNVWDGISRDSAPLRKLRLVDGTRRLIRSPEVLFEAKEVDLDAFGYNVDNESLLSVLRSALTQFPALELIEQPAVHVEIDSDRAAVRLSNGELSAKLLVAADGRNSLCRAAADIRTTKRSLPQIAIALSFSHSRPHRDTSTEFHTEGGPFTLVPLAGLRSSLVWVCTSENADRIRGLSDVELSREIEIASHSILGQIAVDGPRGIFPLGVEIAEHFAASRVALVGEAGHVLPPIGAQGLNLGIRDADSIARIVSEAMKVGGDPGSEATLATYDEERRGDIRSRTAAVELLGRSLITDFLPVHFVRGLGLEIASRIPFLRRGLMRGGLGGRADGSKTTEFA